MSSPHEKAPGRNPEAFDTSINQPEKSSTETSSRGRRAATSLWFAVRTLTGAALTTDDIAIIREAMAEIGKAVQS